MNLSQYLNKKYSRLELRAICYNNNLPRGRSKMSTIAILINNVENGLNHYESNNT
jgi:hypothetical protein